MEFRIHIIMIIANNGIARKIPYLSEEDSLVLFDDIFNAIDSSWFEQYFPVLLKES